MEDLSKQLKEARRNLSLAAARLRDLKKRQRNLKKIQRNIDKLSKQIAILQANKYAEIYHIRAYVSSYKEDLNEPTTRNKSHIIYPKEVSESDETPTTLRSGELVVPVIEDFVVKEELPSTKRIGSNYVLKS